MTSTLAKALVACALLLGVPGASFALGDGELVEADRLSPYARALEISRRMLSPVVHDRVVSFSAQTRVELKEHDIELDGEAFDLHVPESPMPARGYGVVVFVAPVRHMPMPLDWKRELSERGLVLVAARRSGNSQNVIKRRVPLALHGLQYVVDRYRVDPQRVYVAGFSGGSRVAQRIAMGYPDLFRGALLIGGSDRLGENGVVPPPADLMQLFQTRTRIVFATGQEDLPNRAKDAGTRESLADFCVAGVVNRAARRTGHSLPGRRALGPALDALEMPVAVTDDNRRCREDLHREVAAALADASALVAARDWKAAAASLKAIDDRFGGLASPKLETLARVVDRQAGVRKGDDHAP